MLEIHAATRPQSGGRNEDAFFYRLTPLPHAVVCDGAGRADGAAQRACDLFRRLLAEAPLDRLGQIETWLGWVSVLDASLIGVGESTFIACAILENRILGCFVGDSRAYIHGDGETRLLTDSSSKRRLGTGQARGREFCAPFLPGDRLFLLTDGAWTPFDSPARFEALLASHFQVPPHRLPETILEAASATGHLDDMTAVIIFG